MSKHLLHVKSSALLSDGTPKLPTSDQIEYGELALNYSDGNETISIKNSNDNIFSFNLNDIKNKVTNLGVVANFNKSAENAQHTDYITSASILTDFAYCLYNHNTDSDNSTWLSDNYNTFAKGGTFLYQFTVYKTTETGDDSTVSVSVIDSVIVHEALHYHNVQMCVWHPNYTGKTGNYSIVHLTFKVTSSTEEYVDPTCYIDNNPSISIYDYETAQSDFESLNDGEFKMYIYLNLTTLLTTGFGTISGTEATWLFGSNTTKGLSNGDILCMAKYSSLSETPYTTIIRTQDAKPATDTYDGIGADGLETVWDKTQINKISTIESNASTALTQIDQTCFRCYSGTYNAYNCLWYGYYMYVNLGRPSGSASDEYYLLRVADAGVDSSGNYLIHQTLYSCLDASKIYTRIVTTNNKNVYTSPTTTYGEWVKIGTTTETSATNLGVVNSYPQENEYVPLISYITDAYYAENFVNHLYTHVAASLDTDWLSSNYDNFSSGGLFYYQITVYNDYNVTTDTTSVDIYDTVTVNDSIHTHNGIVYINTSDTDWEVKFSFTADSTTTVPSVITTRTLYTDRLTYGCQFLKVMQTIDTDGNKTNYNLTNMPSSFKNFLYDYNNTLNITTVTAYLPIEIDTLLGTFEYCSSLTTLNNLDLWDVTNVNSVGSLFSDCISLQTLDLSMWSFDNLQNMYNFCHNCHSLTSVNISNWDTSNVIDYSQAFGSCYKLQSIIGVLDFINISNWEGTNVFASACKSLTTINIKNLGTQNDHHYLTSLSSSPLSYDSLIYMFDNAYDRATAGYSTFTITLSDTSYGYLSETEIETITNKGYTITTA